MERTGKINPGRSGKEAKAMVSICASLFSEGLEVIEARELALSLAARGIQVHLKPRWLEESGIEQDERGEGRGVDH